MTPEQITGLGPALTEFIGSFKGCLGESRLLDHFATYCRGLLSDLKRKSVEPIALAAGNTVRALQLFISDRAWDHLRLRDQLAQRIARLHVPPPGAARDGDDLGVIGPIDETSVAKQGDETPGVKRQYLGTVGKLDNGIVTVHLGLVHGDFKALLDSDLFLPEDWAADRKRCRRAKIPDDLAYRPKTQIAIEQVRRALANGLRFDWIVFDEGYGKAPAFLFDLDRLGQTWIGEVPSIFRCWPVRPKYRSQRKAYASHEVRNVVRWSPAYVYQAWQPMAFPRQTVGPIVWDIKAAQVHLVDNGQPTDRTYWLIVAWNRATDEYKYFVSNAPPRTKLDRLLKVAFRRSDIEHLFRIAKDQVGLGHFEGRSYVGLMRHMILCQLVVLFLAEQAERLNAERAAIPRPEPDPTANSPAIAPAGDPPRGEKTGPQDASHTSADSTTERAAVVLADPLAACPAAHHHGADRRPVELAVRPLA
jgi:SRSO17 transposase